MARSESSSTTTYTFTSSTVSHLRNDLYCVEWDVKLYYTIPSSTVNTWSNSMRPTVKVCRSQWSSCNTVNVIKTFFKTNIKAKIKCSRPRPRLSLLSSRHLETKNLVSRTTSQAVACLTVQCARSWHQITPWAVVFIVKTTVIYSLGHGLCAPFLQCLGQLSLLPSVGR